MFEAQSPQGLKAVDTGQTHIEHYEIDGLLRHLDQGLLAAACGQNAAALHLKILNEHCRQRAVVINDQ